MAISDLKFTLRDLRRVDQRSLPTAIVSQALDDAAAEMVRKIRNRFNETKADENGRPWPASRDPKIQNRPTGLLVDTGNLRDSIKTVRINQFARKVIQNESEADYGVFHELGIGVPQRSYMGVSASDDDDLSRAYEASIGRLLRGRF